MLIPFGTGHRLIPPVRVQGGIANVPVGTRAARPSRPDGTA